MDKLNYPDLHAHIAALEKEGLLVRVQRPINKDTEMHPLVRWQFRGGIAKSQRRAFLFENVTNSTGRRFEIPVAVGILASNREIYSVGIGCKVEDIKKQWDRAEQQQFEPGAGRQPGLPGDRDRRRRIEREPGKGVDALPIPISIPGFDNAPYASCSMFITKDPDTGRQNIGNYRAMVKSRTRVGMNPEVELNQGIHEHWLKYKARGEKMPAVLMLGAHAGDHLRLGRHKLPKHLDELSVAGGLVGAPIRVCKAKTVDLIVPAEAEIVIEGFIDTEWLEPEGSFGKSQWLHNLKEYNAFMDVTAITRRKDAVLVSIISQVTTVGIEPDQAGGLPAGLPPPFAPSSQHQRRQPRIHARAADLNLRKLIVDPVEVRHAGTSGSLACALRGLGVFLGGRQDDDRGERGYRAGKSRHGDVGDGVSHAPAPGFAHSRPQGHGARAAHRRRRHPLRGDQLGDADQRHAQALPTADLAAGQGIHGKRQGDLGGASPAAAQAGNAVVRLLARPVAGGVQGRGRPRGKERLLDDRRNHHSSVAATTSV